MVLIVVLRMYLLTQVGDVFMHECLMMSKSCQVREGSMVGGSRLKSSGNPRGSISRSPCSAYLPP